MKIFPSANEKLITFVIFSFLSGGILGLLVSLKNGGTGVFLTAIATLVAAFIGAFSAYKLEDNYKKREKEQEKLDHLNKVLFALYERIVQLLHVQKKYIHPSIEDPLNYISMLPTLSLKYPESKYDIEKILFLLKTKHKQLVLDLQLEKERFNSVFGIIDYRSNLHLNEVQPLMEKAKFKNGQEITIDDISDALGERLFVNIQNSTKSMIELVDETIESNIDIKNKLVLALKDLYPNEHILDFEIQ